MGRLNRRGWKRNRRRWQRQRSCDRKKQRKNRRWRKQKSMPRRKEKKQKKRRKRRSSSRSESDSRGLQCACTLRSMHILIVKLKGHHSWCFVFTHIGRVVVADGFSELSTISNIMHQ